MADDNVMRILISTDNHLGYAEKDVVIGDDSFDNFERVLEMARELEVDFVLLGGDLFHDSEPSKNTFVKADRLLSKHCLYDRDTKLKILSDQKRDFAEGLVNFENPNLRIGLPVFSIHGNHDYPHGDDPLSAVDVPSSSGLINYFGKKGIDEDGHLTLSPVLIQKAYAYLHASNGSHGPFRGKTRVALYGLGHIADQRVGHVFRQSGGVTWVPSSEVVSGEDDDDAFNIFVLHQNRFQRGFGNSYNWIEDRHLAEFENLDFVLWGHEHQCLCETQPSSVGDFSILQPGSTVATSLAEGESDPKHAFLLEVQQMQEGDVRHRVMKQRLPGVRPFKFECVALVEQHGVHSSRENSIKEFVRWKLEAMVAQCQRADNEKLPLIRLRIDYTGFDLIPTQEIQKRFTGIVANPDDMLLWTKKPKRKQKGNKAGPTFAADVQEHCLMDELIASELDGKLRILSIDACTAAFQSVFVSAAHANIRTMMKRHEERIMDRVMTMEAEDEETTRDCVKKVAAEIGADVTRVEPIDALLATSPVRRRPLHDRDLEDESQIENSETTIENSVETETSRVTDDPSRTRVTDILRNGRGGYLRQTKRRR